MHRVVPFLERNKYSHYFFRLLPNNNSVDTTSALFSLEIIEIIYRKRYNIIMKNQITKNIEIGKFYLLFDGSEGGHPGFIVWKNDEMNLYIAIKFGTTENDDNIPLIFPITEGKKSYIYKRLFVGKRKDIGKKEFEDFSLTDEVINHYKSIKNNNLVFSKNVSKNGRIYLFNNRNQILLDIKK